MNPTNTEGLYEWASQFDSHGIYDAGKLSELEQFGIPADIVPTYTHDQQVAAIEARGCGGWIEDHGTRTFVGYMLSGALARYVTGNEPGAQFFGRGSAHRANLAALREHEGAPVTTEGTCE